MPTSPIQRARRNAAALLAAALITLSGCGTGATSSSTTIDYWLWNSLQLAEYQKCADEFEAENPDIDVTITQYGFDDYWQKLTAAFVAEAGPDVITNHLERYPEFVNRGVLLPLDELEATAEISPSEFQPGLADLWTGQDGKLYGVPKDFDAIALFYDHGMLEEAGMTPDELEGLTWNPEDGGTFEDVIARLSVDANGVRGDEEGFDPDNVVTYGLGSDGSGGSAGQTQWSWLAGSTGWRHTNADVWGTEYNFDDPDLQASLDWLFSLVDKGFMPPYEMIGTEPQPMQQIGSGQAALIPGGSWNINPFDNLEGIDLGIASLPSGPVGHPVTMYNGLADSISAQTEHPEEAARFTAYLGSDDCQTIIGESGVVFPARPAGTEAAIGAFAERGLDVSPFTDLVDAQHTLYFPVTENASTITAIMQPVMDDIYIGTREPASLTEVNQRINALFE